ncbi:MAG TPA: gamma-glutamyltransferase family protein, partial [Geobacterales bacterium]|nr:gamma-glutamyltransferase family protein [Geobacterales bacterium]
MKLVHGKAAVASQHFISSLIGLKILENGGNAFDAAIAMSAALSVVLPQTGGPGGDGFLLASTPKGLIAYNGSGKSPKNFDAEKFINEKPMIGPLTITVPGLVDMWKWIAERYCRFELKKLLSPAIQLAKEGFIVNRELAQSIARFKGNDEDYLRLYANKKMGDILIQKELGLVLETIAKDPESFYRGKLAETIINGLNKKGVAIDIDDFAEHKGEEMNTINIKFLGYDIHELPPNTQGITTLEILNYVEKEGLYKLDFADSKRLEEHIKIAAMAYEDRDKYIGDPRFMEIDTYELLKLKRNASNIRLNIGDTTFLVVSDKEGNIVGLIQSLFHHFGSGIIVNGVIMQNRAIGFARKKGLPNSPAGNKRPLHTLSIAYAEKDERKIMLGCAGGDLRPQIHAEVLENIICYSMDLGRA